MHKLVLLFILSLSYLGHTQTDTLRFEDAYKDKYEEFDAYAKSSETNELSKFFKNRINTKMLNALQFSESDERKQRVFLTFNLNKNEEIINIKATSKYSEFNKQVVSIFKKYPKKKLNILEKSPLNTYVLQIVSKETGKNRINCSSEIIYDKFPVCHSCEHYTTYKDIKKCMGDKLEEHIINTISLKEIKSSGILGKLKLEPKFNIDDEGNIIKVNSNAPTDNLTKELNRVVKLFPKVKTVGTRNNNPTRSFFRKRIILQIDADNFAHNEENSYKTTKPDTENDLSKHFKQYLNQQYLNDTDILGKKKSITLTFNINANGKLVNIKTNSFIKSLNNKIISAFKKFPIEKLNIDSSSVLELYTYQVITKVNNKYSIKCSTVPKILKYPIFKGCERAKDPYILKQCFSNKISHYIRTNYNKKLLRSMTASRVYRVFTRFKVDTTGKITHVSVKASNPIYAKEATSILNSVPKVKPGYSNRKPSEMSFAIPIVFKVSKQKPKKDFVRNY